MCIHNVYSCFSASSWRIQGPREAPITTNFTPFLVQLSSAREKLIVKVTVSLRPLCCPNPYHISPKPSFGRASSQET